MAGLFDNWIADSWFDETSPGTDEEKRRRSVMASLLLRQPQPQQPNPSAWGGALQGVAEGLSSLPFAMALRGPSRAQQAKPIEEFHTRLADGSPSDPGLGTRLFNMFR